MRCNLGRTPNSIKRITYKYEKEIVTDGLTYKYQWYFPEQKYKTVVKLVQGKIY